MTLVDSVRLGLRMVMAVSFSLLPAGCRAPYECTEDKQCQPPGACLQSDDGCYCATSSAVPDGGYLWSGSAPAYLAHTTATSVACKAASADLGVTSHLVYSNSDMKLNAVAGTAQTVYVVGENGATLSCPLSLGGMTWRPCQERIGKNIGLNATWASDTAAFVVGYNGEFRHYQEADGGIAIALPDAAARQTLTVIAGSGEGDLVNLLVDDRDGYFLRSAGAWRYLAGPPTPVVAAFSTHALFVADEQYHVWRAQPSGAAAVEEYVPDGGLPVVGAWGSLSGAYFLRPDVVLYLKEGGGYEMINGPKGCVHEPLAIWAPAVDKRVLYVAGKNGAVCQSTDDGQWTRVIPPTDFPTTTFVALWGRCVRSCADRVELYLVGNGDKGSSIHIVSNLPVSR